MADVTIDKAMILAAGRGVRMLPITERTPKPMIQVAGRTLIDHALDRLVEAGIKTAVINVHHLADQIERHLKGRRDIEIILSSERDQLLETGGGVARAIGYFADAPFFVINSDALWLDGPAPALERMRNAWRPDGMSALLLVHSTVEAYGYAGRGDFMIDPLGRMIRRPEREVSPYLFTGIQILAPELFADCPDGPFSLNLIYDKAIEMERLYGIVHDGEWFHIGTPAGLDQAEDFMAQRFAGIRHR